MRINTNTAAMNTYSRLGQANKAKSGSLAKLSSGLRINKAGDDAAGLAISEKMKNQISGMKQATRNAQDGISLIQTAEGALNETHSILNRMRDLTVQAANNTNTDADKSAIQEEINSLTDEIDRIATDTEFNTKGLMSGGSVTDTSLDDAVTDYTAFSNAYNDVTDPEESVDDVTFDGSPGEGAKLEALSKSDLNKVVELYNSNNDITAIANDGSITSATDGAADGANIDLDAMTKVYNEVSGKEEGTFGTVTDASTELAKLTDDQRTAVIEKYNSKADISAVDLKTAESTEFSFQIGSNAGQKIDVEIENMNTKGLDLSNVDVVTGDTDAILGKLDKAISSVSTQRANLGAVQNRLDHTVSNLSTTRENLNEANSRIRDVDMAEEMMDFTKSNILSQASTAMLAQANQMPQGVLQLLG